MQTFFIQNGKTSALHGGPPVVAPLNCVSSSKCEKKCIFTGQYVTMGLSCLFLFPRAFFKYIFKKYKIKWVKVSIYKCLC